MLAIRKIEFKIDRLPFLVFVLDWVAPQKLHTSSLI